MAGTSKTILASRLVFISLCFWLPGITTADELFFDGEFDPANWSLTTQGSGTVDSTQFASGGNPDAYFEIATRPTPTAGLTVFGYLFHTDFVFDPAASGAINAVEWTFDYQNITSMQLMGLAMQQDGTIWTADSSVRAGSLGSWFPDGSLITASNLPSGLDLTAGGSPISFGFFVANTFNPAFGDNPNTVGYDNLQIIVTTVPEPGMAWLAAISLVFVGQRRRLRCVQPNRNHF